jgi:cell division protein FtsB
MTSSVPTSEPPSSTQPEGQPAPTKRRGFSLRDFGTRLSLSNLQIILVLLFVIGGQLVIDFGNRIVEGQLKVTQQEALEADIQRLQSEQQRLEEDKTYYNSPAYIQAWAHSDGKMVLPGEKIVIPLYKGQPRPKQPTLPAAPAAPMAKWATWWTLFFDSPPPAIQASDSSSNP